jgi:hypothetical protein
MPITPITISVALNAQFHDTDGTPFTSNETLLLSLIAM